MRRRIHAQERPTGLAALDVEKSKENSAGMRQGIPNGLGGGEKKDQRRGVESKTRKGGYASMGEKTLFMVGVQAIYSSCGGDKQVLEVEEQQIKNTSDVEKGRDIFAENKKNFGGKIPINYQKRFEKAEARIKYGQGQHP